MTNTTPNTGDKIYSQEDFDKKIAGHARKWRRGLQEKAAMVPKLQEELGQRNQEVISLRARISQLEHSATGSTTITDTTSTTATSGRNPYGNDQDDDGTTDDPYILSLEREDDQEPPPPPDPPPPTQDRQETQEDLIARIRREHEEQLVAEQESRRSAERELILFKSLSAAGCIDIPTASRIYGPQMEFDVGTGKWSLNGKDPIEEIGRVLPDYLRKSSVLRSGSGTTPTYTRRDISAEIARTEREMMELQTLAKNSGKSSDVMNYQRTKNRLHELRKQQRNGRT